MSDVQFEKEETTHAPSGSLAARVAILMCTKDGTAFIDDQLRSIAEQTHKNWTLIVSDDGSMDRTVAQVEQFAKAQAQKVTIRKGPGMGVCANFLSLANDPSIEADYFTFSDQDDVWYPDKLQRALAFMGRVPPDVPSMYCGRTELMSVDQQSAGCSPLFVRPPAFENALVQSLAGGNTMMFNRAVKKILEQITTTDVVLHDWWVYQIVTALGGIVFYDPEPMVKYRQHSDNVIGSNSGWRARLARLFPVLGGRFRDWNTKNIRALQKLPSHLITPKNREVLELFIKSRNAPLLKRLYFVKKSGIYRQSPLDNFNLFAAAILKRL